MDKWSVSMELFNVDFYHNKRNSMVVNEAQEKVPKCIYFCDATATFI